MRSYHFSQKRTFASLALAVAVGVVALMNTGHAGALPLAFAKNSAVDPAVVLVRDGCGRDMRFSNSRQACVPDFERERPRYYRDDRVYRDDRGPPPRFIGRGCPPGQRFSNRMQACVWI